MTGQRPSVLRSTALWFVPALLASAALVAIGWGGNPVGLVMIGLAPWLFWLGPLVGAYRAREALEVFAEEIHGVPDAESPILGYPTLRWPAHGIEVEARYRGFKAMALVVRKEGYEGAARVPPSRAREAARAAVEDRIQPEDAGPGELNAAPAEP